MFMSSRRNRAIVCCVFTALVGGACGDEPETFADADADSSGEGGNIAPGAGGGLAPGGGDFGPGDPSIERPQVDFSICGTSRYHVEGSLPGVPVSVSGEGSAERVVSSLFVASLYDEDPSYFVSPTLDLELRGLIVDADALAYIARRHNHARSESSVGTPAGAFGATFDGLSEPLACGDGEPVRGELTGCVGFGCEIRSTVDGIEGAEVGSSGQSIGDRIDARFGDAEVYHGWFQNRFDPQEQFFARGVVFTEDAIYCFSEAEFQGEFGDGPRDFTFGDFRRLPEPVFTDARIDVCFP